MCCKKNKLSRYYYYYAAFNAPCVGRKDDESQARLVKVWLSSGGRCSVRGHLFCIWTAVRQLLGRGCLLAELLDGGRDNGERLHGTQGSARLLRRERRNTLVPRAYAHRGKWGQLNPPGKMDEKLKSDNMRKEQFCTFRPTLYFHSNQGRQV